VTKFQKNITWISLVYVVFHIIVFSLASYFYDKGLSQFLGHFDSGYYAHIALNGYSDKLWVFYPLYPLVL